ncbi:MAG: hypothetical protein ACD_49C00051G0009 [uncultured bacterium (gcode 4)]|uniref:Uncharacterized protein n=1 Tax=uncultured bacterium (gcode 4) TaxID=1234023 RepID=K2AE30_9BACT|nr:MAG: hypothetical protein ACD_49C00051G0009 [uncultured bacterium (gcode 4)]
MRKIIYFVLVGLFSLSLIFLTLYTKEDKILNEKQVKDFLSEDEVLYKISKDWDKYGFNEVKPAEVSGWHFFQKLSPIDGIYYFSKEKDALKISEGSGSKATITLWEGIFIFSLNDIFHNYEINSDFLKIKQAQKWLFVVNNIKGDYKVYSYNAIIDTFLLNEKNKEITSFQLFPSLLFVYNPEYNEQVKNADLLRISTIDKIYYFDAKNENKRLLISGDIEKESKELFKIFNSDLEKKFKMYKNLSTSIIWGAKRPNINWASLAENYPFLFLNDTKKDIILKNDLSQNALDFVSSTNSKDDNFYSKNKANIKNSLDEMKQNEATYNDWIKILKNYYYLSYYSTIFQNNDNILIKDKNNFPKLLNEILNLWQADNYVTLSDIYLAYSFYWLSFSSLNSYIDLYLWNLINSKSIPKDKFWWFSFFLREYLISNIDSSSNSLNILKYMFDLSEKYYANFKWTPDQKINLLSNTFYNYRKIISKLNIIVVESFFIKKDKWYVLKDEFWWENSVQLPAGILDNLEFIYKVWVSNLTSKKDFYYKALWTAASSNIIEYYSSLSKSYDSLKFKIDIFKDYNSYILRLNLNKENKDLKWLDYSNSDNQLSVSAIRDYMSQFNQVDIGSLNVLNNSSLNKDWYYNISIIISQFQFNFKLNPNWNTVYDLVYKDSNWNTIDKFKKLPVPLDEKEEAMADLYSSAETPTDKDKYDFKNIFYNLYVNPDSNSNIADSWNPIAQTQTDDTPVAIKLFIQRELIGKDFKYISNFLPIKFSNIKVTIEWWNYIINLLNVDKSFNSLNNSFSALINSNYDIKTHSFTNMTLKIKDENGVGDNISYKFDALDISIVPSNIEVRSLSNKLKDLWFYLDTISSNYTSWAQILKIDLNLKKVFIDSQSFSVNFN